MAGEAGLLREVVVDRLDDLAGTAEQASRRGGGQSGAPRRTRCAVPGALMLGWSLLLLAPATLALMNAIDQFEWEISRAATGYYQTLPAEQIATLISTVQQREIVATAIYVLVTVGTLGLVWGR